MVNISDKLNVELQYNNVTQKQHRAKVYGRILQQQRF